MADRNKSPAALAEFEALLNAQADYRKGFSPGERVKATVISAGAEYVVMDVKGKHEGLVASEEFRDTDGQLTVKAGDSVEVIFLSQQNGALMFTTQAGNAPMVDQTFTQAQASGLPVEGVVQSEINGGYEVLVSGKRAFCPFSQMSLFRTEGATYIGQKLPFVVVEYGEDGRNIVLSRRVLLEKEREAQREALQASIQPGQVRTGTVSRLTDFGIFVDLGGIDGLIPLKELSWQRDVKPADVAKPGDKVEVLVRETDWERNRVSLSLRATQGDPWDGVMARYGVGSALRGKVTRLERFGAFVEIVPGVEGLVPIGRLAGGRRIISAREVVSEGQELDVQIESIDAERRRISLKPIDDRVAALKPGELAPGVEVEGIVEGIKEFGVFVRLSEKQVGLLHISETEQPKGGSPAARLERAFPPGSKIKVVVKTMDGERIGLTLLSRWQQQAGSDGQDDTASYLAQNRPTGRGLGSLGDAFMNIKL
jgi:small subunit ribosomal protein S1